jgi:hypothetical protein
MKEDLKQKRKEGKMKEKRKDSDERKMGLGREEDDGRDGREIKQKETKIKTMEGNDEKQKKKENVIK